MARLTDEQLAEARDYVAHPCVGYPDCDGDLVAEPHEPECPAYGHPELPHELRSLSNYLDTIAALQRDLDEANDFILNVFGVRESGSSNYGSSQHGRRIRELERQIQAKDKIIAAGEKDYKVTVNELILRNQELKRQLELIPESVRILYIPVEPTKEPT